MIYPKILIIGYSFDLKSGSGITMTNLFKGWDKDKIAVIAEKIENPDFSLCERYYRLGALECKQRFPYNYKTRGDGHKSGIITKAEHGLPSIPITTRKTSEGKRIYHDILKYTGIVDHYIPRLKISNELLEWVREYSPDIIYSMLSSLELIEFVKDLSEKTEIPVAIHIMDDWPATITSYQKGPFKYYWRYRIDKEFRRLLAESKVLLSISEAMSEEYLKRYGFNFQPFHNPIDVEFWGKYPRTNYERNDIFTILYAGRIGNGLTNCLFDVAEAINNLIKRGFKIEFLVQSTTNSPVLNELARYSFVKIKGMAPYSELPRLFSESDMLLLPNDFDRKSISFLKYPMPTKASEYMVSGSPILLYSSNETAVARHAMKHNWAFVVSDNDIGKLEAAIAELYENQELRKQLGSAAKEFGIKHYNNIVISDLFRKSFFYDKELNSPVI